MCAMLYVKINVKWLKMKDDEIALQNNALKLKKNEKLPLKFKTQCS